MPKSEIPRLLRSLGRPVTAADCKELLKATPDEVNFQGFCDILIDASDKQSLGEGQLCEILESLDLTGQGSLDPKRLKVRNKAR